MRNPNRSRNLFPSFSSMTVLCHCPRQRMESYYSRRKDSPFCKTKCHFPTKLRAGGYFCVAALIYRVRQSRKAKSKKPSREIRTFFAQCYTIHTHHVLGERFSVVWARRLPTACALGNTLSNSLKADSFGCLEAYPNAK